MPNDIPGAEKRMPQHTQLESKTKLSCRDLVAGVEDQVNLRTLLIDNYDSYTYNLFQLLAQVNSLEPVVVTNDVSELPDLRSFDNIVISPGPGRPDRILDFGISSMMIEIAEIPILGVCLGHQGLVVSAGGRVVPAPVARHGHVTLVRHNRDELFRGIPEEFHAVRYHSLCAAEPLPDELDVIARAEDGVIMAVRHRSLPHWGVQFHPESVGTEYGFSMITNFRDITQAHRPSHSAVSISVGDTSLCDIPIEPAVDERTISYRALVRELNNAVDAESAFDALYGGSNNAFWLDSAVIENGLSRFSFLGDASGPLAETLHYDVSQKLVTVCNSTETVFAESIFEYLDRELERRTIDAPQLPFDFTGGYVGYFGYELKADCGAANKYHSATPDAVWVFADRFLVVDHEERRTYALALASDTETLAEANRWLSETVRYLEDSAALPEPTPVSVCDIAPYIADNREAYIQRVFACQEHLRQGESYEICLTTSAEVPAGEGGWSVYRRLRRANPAPYSAYLRLADIEIACSSPERFLKISPDRTVESMPIKGTAPRGADEISDAVLRDELASSAKTRAENLMIVDLLRNDLGRVCTAGTVEVPSLMEVRSYATVHQLVSTIRGSLKKNSSSIDCIRSCFPGGSMTGAPKIRTMEIIESIERRARGVYSGSLGYLGCNGSADLNIVIRTMVSYGNKWHIGAGGAIVLQSDPSDEYDEMLLKATAPARVLTVPVVVD